MTALLAGMLQMLLVAFCTSKWQVGPIRKCHRKPTIANPAAKSLGAVVHSMAHCTTAAPPGGRTAEHLLLVVSRQP